MKEKIAYCKKYVKLSDNTLISYVSWINRLCGFSGKERAVEISIDDIAGFKSHLTYLSPRSHAVAHAAINTIFKKVLWGRMPNEFKNNFDSIMSITPKQPHKLPLPDSELLSKGVIQEWFNNIAHPVYHLGCSMLYFSGLKISELCVIPLSAVHPGRIDLVSRSIPIPQNLKILIKRQKRKAKKLESPWFFPSTQNPVRHISASSLQKALNSARPESVRTGSGARTFRASFIVHQLQDGADPNILAYSLGLSGPGQLIPYMKIGGLF